MSGYTSETLPPLTRAQVGVVNRLLVDSYGIDPKQTQELAGHLLALLAKHMLDGDLVDRPIVVLAGRGGNGAGGLVAARHLLNWGAWVQIVCTHATDTDINAAMDAAAHPLHTLQAMGAPLAWAEEGWELPPADLVIDAIIGIGLRDAPHGKARDLIQLANSSAAPILSLSLPSGIDADAGACFTPYVYAAATLALATPTRGLLDAAARPACGDLYLGDVGVPLALYAELGAELGEDAEGAMAPWFARDPLVRWDVMDGVAQVLDGP